MDLFEASSQRCRDHKPLAERMRPQALDEYLGQEQLLAPGKLLHAALHGASLPSMILFGPPGTGKTTLARLLAKASSAELISRSAVSTSLKELREAIATAADQRNQFGRKTVLLLDEIHRYSKSQQDALLPHVEVGTVILIGATTENPSFEVNAALLSRACVVCLQPLSATTLVELARRALGDELRGLGKLNIAASDEILARLAARVSGDARRMYSALEVAAALVGSGGTLKDQHMDEALQQRILAYDKAGDKHYGVISAFIKSLRGSDPDAAVYWMTRMLEAGEDPFFILRRMIIFAAEDVGNADPEALRVANHAHNALQVIGLPEGALLLTQAVIYLACAPKSNTVLTTYKAAKKLVQKYGALPVPPKLLNAQSGLDKALGHGKGYKYPHDFEGNYVRDEYFPEELRHTRIYEPTTLGFEGVLGKRLEALRKREPKSVEE